MTVRLLIDMDGVVCDFLPPLITQYNHLAKDTVLISDIKEYQSSKFFKKRGIWFAIKDAPGFIRNLEPIIDTIPSIEKLHNMGYDIVFVSNATNCPTSGHEKREWLKYYFGHLWSKPKLVLTYHKYLVKGDCLLDDNPANLEALDKEVVPLLFHQHYNLKEDRFRRIFGWREFIKWVVANKPLENK